MSVFICLCLPCLPHCQVIPPARSFFSIYSTSQLPAFNQTLSSKRLSQSVQDSIDVPEIPGLQFSRNRLQLAPPWRLHTPLSCLERDSATTVVFTLPDHASQYWALKGGLFLYNGAIRGLCSYFWLQYFPWTTRLSEAVYPIAHVAGWRWRVGQYDISYRGLLWVVDCTVPGNLINSLRGKVVALPMYFIL